MSKWKFFENLAKYLSFWDTGQLTEQNVPDRLHIVRSDLRVHKEQTVPMDVFAENLRKRARQLGISNAEAARQSGLEERRYAHYVSDRREPDLATLVKIADALDTTPNLLLGVADPVADDPKKAALLERLSNAAASMSLGEFKNFVIQAEAIADENLKKSGRTGTGQ